MGILLHGANGSPYVRKVRVILEEKSLPYEQNPVIPFGVSDEYKQKSPLGKIPCLEDVDAARWPKLSTFLERVLSRPSFTVITADEEAFFSGGN